MYRANIYLVLGTISPRKNNRLCYSPTFCTHSHITRVPRLLKLIMLSDDNLTISGPQSRFGDKLLKFSMVCPQNGIAVLKGLNTITAIPRRLGKYDDSNDNNASTKSDYWGLPSEPKKRNRNERPQATVCSRESSRLTAARGPRWGRKGEQKTLTPTYRSFHSDPFEWIGFVGLPCATNKNLSKQPRCRRPVFLNATSALTTTR